MSTTIPSYSFLESRDKCGNTPLLWSVLQNREDLLIKLITQGANVNQQNYRGDSALHLATKIGNHTMIVTLCQAGVDPNISGPSGITPLHLAAAIGDEISIRILVEYGAFLNVFDDNGDTPLHYAIRESKANSVGLLLHNKVDKNAKNNDGESPLFFAISLKESKIAHMLIVSGANVTDTDYAGTSVLQEAKLTGNFEITSTLENNGAIFSKPQAPIVHHMVNNTPYFQV